MAIPIPTKSIYYELTNGAGLEALADMRIDALQGVLDYANQLIDEMNKAVLTCDINVIAGRARAVSQQIGYAKGLAHENMTMLPRSSTDDMNKMTMEVETRLRDVINGLNKKCNCLPVEPRRAIR
jgi:hypothetical protein